MKKLLAIAGLMVLSSLYVQAQKLEIGLGTALSKRAVYDSPVDLDSIVFYERDYNGRWGFIPSIRYTHPVGKSFDLSLGLQIQNSIAGLTVEKRRTDSTEINSKLTSAGVKAFEIPVVLQYSLSADNGLHLKAFAGVISIFTSVDFDPRFREGPQYPASIAEGLNKAGTLPKRFHMDYLVGGRLSYWRLNLDVYYQSNITGNLNNNLEIWGHEFLFKRRTESVRLLLSYSIPLGAKE